MEKIEAINIRILTKEEQQRFIEVLPFYNTGNLFAVALATGIRIGELCALEVSDIDRKQQCIHINKSSGRRRMDKYTGEVGIQVNMLTKYSIRKIPLLPSVEMMIDRQLKLNEEMRQRAGNNWNENVLLFPTELGNAHDISGIRTAMERIVKRAGLEHMTVQALRHTYAATALSSGAALQNVANIMGHKDGAETLKHYARHINIDAMTHLKALAGQNTGHLGITAAELRQVVFGAETALEKTSVNGQVGEAITMYKNMPPKKSVEQVLSVCEDVLCQSPDKLPAHDKEVLLGVLGQYTAMKRCIAEQERAAKAKKSKTHER
ncbi:MAG: site-specific integrase [Oscillospiraceae bacterium]|jgi:hypothetical protein|nr:site-specific integrase [Oscillospiraceae bacterium]